jgi:hypothetical protein
MDIACRPQVVAARKKLGTKSRIDLIDEVLS